MRTIVLNCYRHHGREDLLPNFPSEPNKPTLFQLSTGTGRTLIQAINNPDGSTSYVAIDTGDAGGQAELVTLSDGTNARVLHAVRFIFHSAFCHCFLAGPAWGRGAGAPPFPLVSSLPRLLLCFYFFLLSLALTIFFFCPSLSFLPE